MPTNKKCQTAESIIKINEKTVHQLRHTAKSTAFLAITSLKRHAWLLYYQDNRPKKCHQKMKCRPRNANTITKSWNVQEKACTSCKGNPTPPRNGQMWRARNGKRQTSGKKEANQVVQLTSKLCTKTNSKCSS